MGVRKVITCDLCGKDLTTGIDQYLVIPAKYKWYSWDGDGFSRTKIYICEGCQKRLKAAAVYSRKQDEEDEE